MSLDEALYAGLPDEAKSVFYGRPYYEKYLAIVNKKISETLKDAEFPVTISGDPVFYFDEGMLGFAYTFLVHFSNAEDAVLKTCVVERGEDTPTWIVALKQRLPFVEIVPVTASDEPGVLVRVFIDFRRTTPPNWVKERRAARATDSTVDVAPYLRSILPTIDTMSLDADRVVALPVNPLAPPLLAGAGVLHAAKKQSSLVEMFAKRRKVAHGAAAPAAASDAMDVVLPDTPPVEEVRAAMRAKKGPFPFVDWVRAIGEAAVAECLRGHIGSVLEVVFDPAFRKLRPGAKDVLRALREASRTDTAPAGDDFLPFVSFQAGTVRAATPCALSGRTIAPDQVAEVHIGATDGVRVFIETAKVNMVRMFALAYVAHLHLRSMCIESEVGTVLLTFLNTLA